jgi:L-threonylcarbamoyladenylate synthase
MTELKAPGGPGKGASAPAATRRLAASPEAIRQAAAVLRRGGLVAFPTETVYGLGADAANGEAVAALYAAKGRPRFNPLIAHFADGDAARREGRFDTDAERLAAAFWPGPLTLVVPAATGGTVALLARAGLGSVALRVPAHPVAQALIAAFGGPIVAPSANRSGHVSPTTAAHVMADLDGRIDFVLDGGPTHVGVESTIVACLGKGPPRLLRPGGVPRAAIERVLGHALAVLPGGEGAPQSPGMLPSHYAPRARLRLGATAAQPGEAVLRFAGRPAVVAGAAAIRELSAAGDLAEAAANLFGHLRARDEAGAAVIAVGPVPTEGLGEAINDRLARAAAPR